MKNMILKQVKKITSKKDGGKEILTELGLIIIGVVLLILFKGQLIEIVTTVGAKVGEQIKALF